MISLSKIAPESSFIMCLFERINSIGIRYAVLRNYETLPYSANGSDVDILFSDDDFFRAHKELISVAEEHGGRCISLLKSSRVLDLVFCGKSDNGWWGVRFDTFSYAGTNGCDILPAEALLSRGTCHNGVRVACLDDAAIISFLKEVIGAGHDNKNYLNVAEYAFDRDKLFFSSVLPMYFGEMTFIETIVPLLNRECVDFKFASKRLRRGWRQTAFKRHSLKFIFQFILDIVYKICRLIKPPGFSIAVLGVDGSGKSTIINQISTVMEVALHNKVRYSHLRPNLLPSIALLFGRPVKSGPVVDPHSSKPSGPLGSIIRLSYYGLDYVFGYWFKVHIDKARGTHLWVFDRYFYDYLIDPYRSRVSLPRWIIRSFCFFMPKPDLVLCLGSDPELIHQRKPELPLAEVERQVDELKKLCGRLSNSVWIDTGCSIDESVDNALEAITSAMAARYRF